ncbi:sensor histidine kinase [Sedimentibacter saalensis]|uniref:histidine kinase n=1 Tax=Sedimentibacter saalensis TaxID=130788 RepID=A0A562JC40_9FIRM|nr:HAMP domain-containing sensor histidine kinase [Sedimentibacter saalensis]TWH80757.1 signal transduction histidine kinase [Sedimentibacter saalensis]
MIKISEQLRKYFVMISILSIAFITISSNIGINYFFSDYIRDSRSRDDLKVVQYVERVYSDYEELNSHSLMNIMHYAFSEDVIIQIRDKNNNISWNSSSYGTLYGMVDEYGNNEANFSFRSYPFIYNESEIGTIDVGRPKSIISNIEDEKFIVTINSIFALASVLTFIFAVRSSTRISKKFLNPIYAIKENAKLIEQGKYKSLNDINTNTFELYELSVSVKELAERLNYQEHLRKRMTTDIAHELRTPIAAIQSHIEAFMDGVWEPNDERLSVIHGEIIRLTKLIDELSELSIVEDDEINLKLSTINLSVVLNDIIDSYEPMFLDKNINLNKKIQNEVYMMGDMDYLKRIFVNILSNAIKYTNENGSASIFLEKIKDKIRITVNDTGIGIPKEDLKYIFERFYRSDLSRNRQTGGTGIGLTITKALVEAHEGTIKIDSEVGKGTSVIIEFNR